MKGGMGTASERTPGGLIAGARGQVPRPGRGVERRRVAPEFAVAQAHPPADARPPPLLRPHHQPALDRVHVDVPDLAPELIRVADVAVKAAAGLPELVPRGGPAAAVDLRERPVVQGPQDR